MHFLKNQPFYAVYENSLTAFVPQHWANESVAILLENMVAANLVHRDFEMEFAKYGDVVNTRKPAEFSAKRKTNADSVTVQDASATNIAVPLDQHVHVSFLIKDGEETKSFKSLVDEYLRPAAIAMARSIDQIVLGQVYQFLDNSAGTLAGLTTSNGPTYITDTRKVMNNNKAPMENRHLILTTTTESKLLQNAIFIQANTVGDQGGAMAEATLGRKFGFDIWLDQNMSSVSAQTLTATASVLNGGNITKGSTVLTLTDDATTPTRVGAWITINGIPYRSNASGATSVTIDAPGLREDVAGTEAVKVQNFCEVNNGAGYAAGYAKDITIDGAAAASLQVGQLVTFENTATRYTVIQRTATTMLLDRPLVAAIVDNDDVNFGPSGEYNFALHRNCLSLVVRPLNLPRAGTGAVAGLASFNGVAMRTTITYDGNKQGHLVTLDFLAGIKVLDTALGAVMLA